MSDMETRPPAGPTTGQFLYGLLFIAAIGVLGIVAGAFALANATCACTTPPDLIIVNQSHAVASVDWETAGLLGTPLLRSGGHIDAAACEVSSWNLDPGNVTTTVGSRTATRTAHFTVTGRMDRPAHFLLIDAQGQISDSLADWPPGTDNTTTCP